MLAVSENKYLEPSGLAGMFGPIQLFRQKREGAIVRNITWNMPYMSSGEREEHGSKEEMAAYNRIGADLLKNKQTVKGFSVTIFVRVLTFRESGVNSENKELNLHTLYTKHNRESWSGFGDICRLLFLKKRQKPWKG